VSDWITYVEHETVVYIRFGDVCVEVLAFDESEEEFVDDLDMRPCYLQYGLVFLWVERFALRVHRWWDRSEQVLCEHLNYARVHLLGNDLAVVGHVVEQLVQGQTLDLLRFHIAASIVEVEDDVALVDLLHEELLPLVWGHFVESWQLLQLTLTLIRDVEARRMLPLRGSYTLNVVLGRCLEAVEDARLRTCLRGRKVARHRLGCTRGRDML
jgi:hypothetical protein